MPIRAVLFDVDFTIAKPGPDLGPEGYQRLGERFGLELEPERYADARAHAVTTLERHPELDHDEQVWVLFTEQIIRGMGGNSDRAYECAVEMTRAWEHAHNFQIFEDVLPALAELREHRLKLGLVSNTGRNLDQFIRHHDLDVDAAVSSGAHGKTKPHPTLFLAALERLAGEPGRRGSPQAAPDDLPGRAGEPRGRAGHRRDGRRLDRGRRRRRESGRH